MRGGSAPGLREKTYLLPFGLADPPSFAQPVPAPLSRQVEVAEAVLIPPGPPKPADRPRPPPGRGRGWRVGGRPAECAQQGRICSRHAQERLISYPVTWPRIRLPPRAECRPALVARARRQARKSGGCKRECVLISPPPPRRGMRSKGTLLLDSISGLAVA